MSKSRHRKPSDRQLLERIHRYQREDRALLRSHAKILADHCARLLREKVTLQSRLEAETRKRIPLPTLSVIGSKCDFSGNTFDA